MPEIYQNLNIPHTGHKLIYLPKIHKPEFIFRLTPAQARGIIWIFHPPESGGKYVIAGDPSVGLPGWHRGLSSEEDLATDNAAATVWRIYSNSIRQEAEFAAPIEPREFASVLNALGRYYAGSDAMNMARLILESCVGPGPECEREIIGKYAYYNYWTPRELSGIELSAIGQLGWRPSLQSNKDISLNARRLIEAKEVTIRSPWLKEELIDAELDKEKWKIHIPEGGSPPRHDDRLRSMMLGLWAIMGQEVSAPAPKTETDSTQVVKVAPAGNWQNTDISLDKLKKIWEHRVQTIINSR